MFDKVAGIITNYVEVKKEDIKPESRLRVCWASLRKNLNWK